MVVQNGLFQKTIKLYIYRENVTRNYLVNLCMNLEE